MADVVVFDSTGQSPTANTRVWTDEVDIGGSTTHAQIVKLANPTLDSTAMLGMTSGGLNVAIVNTTVPISGNSTAILSTASVVRIQSTAALDVTIAGNSTAIISSASIIRAESTGVVHVDDNGAALTIDGNSTAIISTVSAIRIDSTAALAVTLTTASITRIDTVASLPQSSVTISTGGVGGMVSNPLWTAPALITESTYANVRLTSTTAGTALSSAGSTRFSITGLLVTNDPGGGGAASTFSLFDGSTSGAALWVHTCASAGGGFSFARFSPPLRGTAGNAIVVQCHPASTMSISMNAIRTT